MSGKEQNIALTYLAVGLVIGILFMCYGGYQALCNRRDMQRGRYLEYMTTGGIIPGNKYGMDLLGANRGYTGTQNIGGFVFDPAENSSERYSDFDPNLVLAAEEMGNMALPGANMNNIFIDPNEDNGPEDIVRMDNFVAYGKEVAKPRAALNRFWPEPSKEGFSPPQRAVIGNKVEEMTDIGSSWGKINYTDKNIQGVPDVVATYAGAYQKAYNLVGKTVSGDLVYEFYGLSKDGARAKWNKAFPGYEYPKSIQ